MFNTKANGIQTKWHTVLTRNRQDKKRISDDSQKKVANRVPIAYYEMSVGTVYCKDKMPKILKQIFPEKE